MNMEFPRARRSRWKDGRCRYDRFHARLPLPCGSYRVSLLWPFSIRFRGLSRLLQGAAVDRHLAQALAGRGEDRIGNGGNDGCGPGFAHSTRRLGALDDMDVDGGCLIDAEHLVGVEVGLLDAAVFQRDLAMQSGRDAE